MLSEQIVAFTCDPVRYAFGESLRSVYSSDVRIRPTVIVARTVSVPARIR